MCGLIGRQGLSGWLHPTDALQQVAHRGPDGQAWEYVDSHTWLGHTRLAIQDTTDAASQPIRSGSLTLTYNGEAWNVEELRASLPGPWTSTGDAEVIARLLEHHGVAGLEQIDGMFAMAWHDGQQTWLARDRYGKIPLYVADSLGGYTWASEIKALDGEVGRPVEPGTAWSPDTGKTVEWVPAPSVEPITDPSQVAVLLEQGVRKRLLSDRPVCFLLSGGLDSTFVLSLARRLHPNPVAYTAVYDPASADLAHARDVAAEFGVPLVEVQVPKPTGHSIWRAVSAVEVPMKAQVEIALANLPLAQRIAHDGFRVVLSGEAADELFGGYGSMAIKSARLGDDGWSLLRRQQVAKMSRGNFMRVNKVFMAHGVEARLPFMERDLVEGVLAASKTTCPPGKGLLKAAAQGYVPDYVIRRPKDTFQGGCGISAAAADVLAEHQYTPAKFYNSTARRLFGFLPKG